MVEQADNISYLMSRINISRQSNSESANAMLLESDQPPLQSSSSSSSSKEDYNKKKRDLKDDYCLDGLNCSICIEPWTLHGDHQVSCLPCGHIYGLSCINKWIQLRSSTSYAKCPQCNAKIDSKNVTKLYASPVCLVDNKKDEMPKSKDLETERSNLLHIQDSLLKELRLLKKQMSSTGTVHPQRNSDEAFSAELVHETQNGIKYGSKVDTSASHRCNFVLEHEMSVGGARVFDMDSCYKVLLVAQRVPRMGGRHVLEKINMINPGGSEKIQLPMSTKAVKDLHLSPCGRLALLASLGKKLSIISMGGNSIVVTYNLPSPAWSCSWDINSPNYMYAGLQNGMLLVFDMRRTVHPVETMPGLDERPIHTIHSYEHNNTCHPQDVPQLLTASTAGSCLWNINGGMERSFKISELETPEALCMSLAYSSLSEDIIATYRPKDDSPLFKRPPPSTLGEFEPNLLHHVKRVASRFYVKSESASARLGDEWITKSTIINVENCLPMFAYANDVANGLKLLEIPSLAVRQNLKPHQHPILDVKYSQSRGSSLLGCISKDKLQLFSAKVL